MATLLGNAAKTVKDKFETLGNTDCDDDDHGQSDDHDDNVDQDVHEDQGDNDHVGDDQATIYEGMSHDHCYNRVSVGWHHMHHMHHI